MAKLNANLKVVVSEEPMSMIEMLKEVSALINSGESNIAQTKIDAIIMEIEKYPSTVVLTCGCDLKSSEISNRHRQWCDLYKPVHLGDG